MNKAVLMQGVQNLVEAAQKRRDHHPGLTLDKHSPAGKQETQKSALDIVCQASGDSDLLAKLAARRVAAFTAGTVTFTATTAGPLTLHLSRATAFENAGIALHPLYGFAYLPGSGLKGAARAYAETIWLPAQSDKAAASQAIVHVFGCAPAADASPEGKTTGQAGSVIFHDAWPETWPRLFVDVAAVHHSAYYQAPEAKVPPPGDWEDPKPINFLAIAAGTKFQFVLAPRRMEKEQAALAHARDWLEGAMTMLGIGAKTAAGYGYFTSQGARPANATGRDTAEFQLTLVTPAFLAGAGQGESDCDLRGATLRGQLRWWWRTMHTAHLAPAELRRLESALWGASSQGSALHLRLTQEANPPPVQFTFNVEGDGKFLADNRIEQTNRKVPEAERRKTTQGLYYAAFGAGVDRKTGKAGRFFRQPGSGWRLHITARECKSDKDRNGKTIPAEMALQQATAAVFLLTRYGGVGAKSRNGLGSLADCACEGISSIEDCKRLAQALRSFCDLSEARQADAPALEQMSDPVIVPTRWTNPWFAVNRIGEAMQSYAKTGKHQAWKVALGLPRKSDHPAATRVHDSKELRPIAIIPVTGKIQLSRHASPIFYHVGGAGDALEVRLVTFISRHLPDEATSRERLAALRKHAGEFLAARASD